MKQNLIEKTLTLNTIQNKKGDCVLEQKQSRQLKKQITDNIITTLLEKYDIDRLDTLDGTYLIIPNEEEGFVPVLLEVVMKPLDIDTETLKNEYQSKMEENKRKEEEKKKKTEKK